LRSGNYLSGCGNVISMAVFIGASTVTPQSVLRVSWNLTNTMDSRPLWRIGRILKNTERRFFLDLAAAAYKGIRNQDAIREFQI
jgi:hypothetical protein